MSSYHSGGNRNALYNRKTSVPRTREKRNGFTYRREAGAELKGGGGGGGKGGGGGGGGGGGEANALPTLYLSKKLSAKKGMLFKNAPMWDSLKDDDRVSTSKKMKYSEVSVKSQKKLDEMYESILDDEKKRKKKRRAKRDPSVKKVREHMRKIVAYHEKVVDEEIPSIYPILGPCNSDDEEESGNEQDDEKRLRTKKELWKK